MAFHLPRRSRPGRRWYPHVIGLLLAIGTTTGALASVRPVSTQLPEPVPDEAPAAYIPSLVEAPALKALLAGPDAPVIVDVRSPQMYALGHLKGAINLPGHQLAARLGEVPLGVRLALYCS